MPLVVIEIGVAPVPAGVTVTPAPLITVWLPVASVKVPLVKPVRFLAILRLNVLVALSPTTAMLPSVTSAPEVTEPLIFTVLPSFKPTVSPESPAMLIGIFRMVSAVLYN